MVVGGRELIDTLWNVNKVEIKEIKKEEPRINRYIMECKSLIISAIFALLSELIDTLWNVNFRCLWYHLTHPP